MANSFDKGDQVSCSANQETGNMMEYIEVSHRIAFCVVIRLLQVIIYLTLHLNDLIWRRFRFTFANIFIAIGTGKQVIINGFVGTLINGFILIKGAIFTMRAIFPEIAPAVQANK